MPWVCIVKFFYMYFFLKGHDHSCEHPVLGHDHSCEHPVLMNLSHVVGMVCLSRQKHLVGSKISILPGLLDAPNPKQCCFIDIFLTKFCNVM
jgi:hypothetical protein